MNFMYNVELHVHLGPPPGKKPHPHISCKPDDVLAHNRVPKCGRGNPTPGTGKPLVLDPSHRVDSCVYILSNFEESVISPTLHCRYVRNVCIYKVTLFCASVKSRIEDMPTLTHHCSRISFGEWCTHQWHWRMTVITQQLTSLCVAYYSA